MGDGTTAWTAWVESQQRWGTTDISGLLGCGSNSNLLTIVPNESLAPQRMAVYLSTHLTSGNTSTGKIDAITVGGITYTLNIAAPTTGATEASAIACAFPVIAGQPIAIKLSSSGSHSSMSLAFE
jgi:hypothetical protein